MEINNWELKNRSMEEEVVALKAEKEELQYILAAHMSTCALQVKVELASEEESPVFVQVQPSQETVKPQRPERPGSLSLQSVGASQDQLQPQHSKLISNINILIRTLLWFVKPTLQCFLTSVLSKEGNEIGD